MEKLPQIIRLSYSGHCPAGRIHIGGSKSISNRVLILKALSSTCGKITNLSDADDTQTLLKLLASNENELNAGHAGTTFRFLTAYLCLQDGTRMLTGSPQLQKRPVGPLVDALIQLGASIEYVGETGYPPLKITGPLSVQTNKVSIRSDISSQFLSALCMIGPKLKGGLTIELTGDQVSKPYLDMTLSMMKEFGASVKEEGSVIIIAEGDYNIPDYMVESDWSSASYYFALAAMAKDAHIQLTDFKAISLQADSAIKGIASKIGVIEKVADNVLHIKSAFSPSDSIEHDFIKHPDIAQTLAVTSAACDIPISYRGLKTLSIKETDRVAALQTELAKIGVTLEKDPSGIYEYVQDGEPKINEPVFDTYEDHRMAMSLAPIALLAPIQIKNPQVVSKSYPNFWKDLESLGFVIEVVGG